MTFRIAIVDEAHRLKNRKAAVTQAAKTLNATARFALTGMVQTTIRKSPERLTDEFPQL
jgi:hypothetical protein